MTIVDSIGHLLQGFGTALALHNILYALAGTGIGMLVGVLPGLGPAAATALLLPLTYSLDTTGSIIMLAAIYYGSQFGGTITSVLLNVPGEASSAITCLDGHPMAQAGRAGAALTIAAVGSAFAGVLATVGLIAAAPVMSGFALSFGPPEQFALMVFATTLLMALAGRSMLKALMMGVLGLFLATVGLDPTQGYPRYTFGMPELFDGLSFVPIVMGLFGLADIMLAVERGVTGTGQLHRVDRLLPTAAEARASAMPVLRGSVLGFVLGLVPGMMPSISSFLSYIAEKTVSRTPGRFGHGAVEGVAGPESANNAHATSSLIPLLTMGIPTTPTIALILGAFLIKGLVPGPLLFRDHPDVIWGVIASFFIGNAILLLWNIPLIRLWVSILRIPPAILYALIIVFMIVGAYSEYGSMFGVALLLASGLVGYWMKKLDFPVAPLVLALVIGPMMETSLMRSLEMYPGNAESMLTRPIVLTMMIMAVAVVVFFSLRSIGASEKFVRADAE
ncbi:tripartite tricarboxylate transporter permease [Pigmentiphaga soli]|uniref:Tripartite tricarboxylate transporter permease n=1 Tax=Pigmentiphaga soli TaxID=1007095 RepID=A0ABP8GFC3_9BURK